MFIIYNCRTMSLLEVYHICISNSTLYTSYNLYFLANSQRKHQVQTRHFNRISALIITLSLLAVQPMLFRIFAGFPSAFLTVRRQETDRQTGLCQLIRNTALNIGFFQSAKVRVLLSKSSQPLFQSGVVGVDICLVLALIKENDCFFLNLRQSRHSSPPYGFSTHAACSKSSDTTFQHPQHSA